MPVKTIVAAASPDEPRRSSAVDADDVVLDDVAIERVVSEWAAQFKYGDDFPDRYRPTLPTLTAAELREAGRRMRQLRRERGRSYRFVCSRAAGARREAQQ